jgi:hypothetical protein
MSQVSAAVFDALRRALSSDAVDTSEETIAHYGRNDLPGGDRRPAGVVRGPALLRRRHAAHGVDGQEGAA